MSDAYVGEIRWLPYVRGAPVNWLPCDGRQLSVSTYQVLFTLIGTTYGGNGSTTFSVPDLRSRIAIHQGQGTGLQNYPIGSSGGSEQVSLTTAQLGGHSHTLQASTQAATSMTPVSPSTLAIAAVSAADVFYTTGGTAANAVPLNALSVGSIGSGLSHENVAPTLTLTPCICYNGIYPTRS